MCKECNDDEVKNELLIIGKLFLLLNHFLSSILGFFVSAPSSLLGAFRFLELLSERLSRRRSNSAMALVTSLSLNANRN